MKHPLKILYAEDDVLLNELTTELLKGEGIDCVSVFNGEEARFVLEKETFDLLLTDFQMPKMNGAELLFWCRKNAIHLPVIFLSGNLDRLSIEELALKDCCTTVLTKPAAFSDLLRVIEVSTSRSHEFDCRPDPDAEFPGQHRTIDLLERLNN